MSTTTTIDARPDGHGHVIAIDGQDGREIKFDSVWDWHEEAPCSVVAWTHDLTDAEVLAHARAYVDGPFTALFGDWELDDAWEGATVRRAWARWRPPTATERRAAEEEYGEGDDVRWEEHDEPGNGLQPACVVDLDA